MGANEVDRLFEEIQRKYEQDDRIDPGLRAALFEEIMKYVGGGEFVEKLKEAFNKIENGDDDNEENSEDDEYESESSASGNRVKFDIALSAVKLFKFKFGYERIPVQMPQQFNQQALPQQQAVPQQQPSLEEPAKTPSQMQPQK